MNKSESLGQGCSAFEKKFRVTVGQTVIECVKDETNPEVFLRVLMLGVEAFRRSHKCFLLVFFRKIKKGFESLVHDSITSSLVTFRTMGRIQAGR